MILYSIVVLITSLTLMGMLSDRIIRYVSALSTILGLSEMAAGFILLSVTTSLPELSVSALAAFREEAGLSVGNVLGSNVANLTVIIGLAVLISNKTITVERQFQKELIQFLFLSSIIPLFILQRGSLGLILGLVLLILFVYFGIVVSQKAPEIKPIERMRKRDRTIIIAKFWLSVALIILISKFVVDSSLEIAGYMDLPPSIVGATIVGLGTSLPELATTIQAFKKKLYGMALGNLLGSCVTNITLILGVSSLLSPSKVSIIAVESIMFYVLLSSLSIWYMIGTNERISRRDALFLCGVYAFFVLQQIGISIFIL
ncbi:MAG: sodium:calcium antiporter [Candidatus Bathyarchaeota archaeon]|nr:MAG: sodium:calcium antiporter [Candidatus Bathyarchaeota archaeon]